MTTKKEVNLLYKTFAHNSVDLNQCWRDIFILVFTAIENTR